MIAVSFKTKVFRDVLPLVLQAYEKKPDDAKLIEGLARIHFYLGNRKNSIELFRKLYKLFPKKINFLGRNYTENPILWGEWGVFFSARVSVSWNEN